MRLERGLQQREDGYGGNYAAVIDELEPYYGSDLPARYAEMNAMYESACLMRAQELTAREICRSRADSAAHRG